LHEAVMDEADRTLFKDIVNTKEKIEGLLTTYKFREALYEVIDLSRKGNKYMQDKQPWIVAKQVTPEGQLTPEAQKLVDNSLHVCLQLVANLAVLVNPFLPFTAKKMCYMMKVVDKMLEWENAGKSKLLSVGYSLRAPELLFRKIDDTEVTEQVEKLKAKKLMIEKNAENAAPATVTTPVATMKPEIVFDDFAKIDLKVGTIVSAAKVEKADKLLKLEVDLGFETRTIVSGIALHFAPEAITGKQVVVVANLAPRKMRGIESQGMILMAEDKEGKLHFVSPASVIDAGSNVT